MRVATLKEENSIILEKRLYIKKADTQSKDQWERLTSQQSQLAFQTDSSKKTSFFKKAKKVLSVLSDVLQVFDGAMAIFAFVEMFLPASDSPELAFMKTQFSIVNNKLDNLASGQDTILSAIEFHQLIKDVEPGAIETLHSRVLEMQEKLSQELWSEME